MADNNESSEINEMIPEELSEEHKKIMSDIISNTIKKRLKNKSQENEELKKKLEEYENNALSNPSTQEDRNSYDNNMNNPDIGKILDAQTERFMKTLDQKNQEDIQRRKEQESIQAIQSGYKKIQDLLNDDKDFKKTVSESKFASNFPHEVALHIVNQFDPNVSKKILKDLHENEPFYLRMENAYLKSKHDNGNAYNEWLNNLLNSPTSKSAYEPKNVPDLGNEGGDADTSSSDNIDRYLFG